MLSQKARYALARAGRAGPRRRRPAHLGRTRRCAPTRRASSWRRFCWSCRATSVVISRRGKFGGYTLARARGRDQLRRGHPHASTARWRWRPASARDWASANATTARTWRPAPCARPCCAPATPPPRCWKAYTPGRRGAPGASGSAEKSPSPPASALPASSSRCGDIGLQAVGLGLDLGDLRLHQVADRDDAHQPVASGRPAGGGSAGRSCGSAANRPSRRARRTARRGSCSWRPAGPAPRPRLGAARGRCRARRRCRPPARRRAPPGRRPAWNAAAPPPRRRSRPGSTVKTVSPLDLRICETSIGAPSLSHFWENSVAQNRSCLQCTRA